MSTLLVTVLIILALLIISEIWWRTSKVHSEVSRKFVHITVGSFVAFWPYFLTANQIKLLSLAFLAVVSLSKSLDIFKAIHSVQRPTRGEFWFALVVGLLAFLVPHHQQIYTVALLEMSLADGLAAVIGTRYGNSHRYTILGSPKSLIGTLTFFVVSCAILITHTAITLHLSLLIALPIALGATILENVAAHGLDNLVVPLFVAGALWLVG